LKIIALRLGDAPRRGCTDKSPKTYSSNLGIRMQGFFVGRTVRASMPSPDDASMRCYFVRVFGLDACFFGGFLW
jgi:hypothetical protein